ncbi:hypothetical protein KAU13_05975 [candidate division WOR-3 bacterium]|nr:hypothetical protein [candidate division WOR-3 bacterium]
MKRNTSRDPLEYSYYKTTPIHSPQRQKSGTAKGVWRDAESVELKIYNVTGELLKSFLLPTTYSLLPTVVSWDGTDDKGNIVPNGTYFYQLNVGNKSITKSMTLIR